jgi:hypothetical protein
MLDAGQECWGENGDLYVHVNATTAAIVKSWQFWTIVQRFRAQPPAPKDDLGIYQIPREFDAKLASTKPTKLITTEGPRGEVQYPLGEEHKDKCPNRVYEGGLTRYRCCCDNPSKCPGVLAVAEEAANEEAVTDEDFAKLMAETKRLTEDDPYK